MEEGPEWAAALKGPRRPKNGVGTGADGVIGSGESVRAGSEWLAKGVVR